MVPYLTSHDAYSFPSRDTKASTSNEGPLMSQVHCAKVEYTLSEVVEWGVWCARFLIAHAE